MQLMLNKTSPYARVARIAALEKGLGERLELCWVDPWADDPQLLAVNPLCRVPTLRTADGRSLTEALLIALYLDQAGEGASLFPAADLAAVLQLAGLGQGLMEAAFNTVIARKHGGAEADATVLGRRRLAAIQRTVGELARLIGQPAAAGVNIGSVSVAVALDYLAFRLPEIGWGEAQPALQAWQERLLQRESFRATAFA